MLRDILGSFIPDPMGTSPFVLQPAGGPCLLLEGEDIAPDNDGYKLCAGEVEAGGRLDRTVRLENIGLDPMTVTVEENTVGDGLEIEPLTASLPPGEDAAFTVGLLLPSAIGVAIEHCLRFTIERPGGQFEIPLSLEAQTGQVGPAPSFFYQGGPCPETIDFGDVDARLLMKPEEADQSSSVLTVAASNNGKEPYVLTVTMEGEGFTLTGPGEEGAASAEVSPEGLANVTIRPTPLPLGKHQASLWLTATHPRRGTLATRRLALTAAVRALGPLFSVEPVEDRLRVAAQGRGRLELTLCNFAPRTDQVTIQALAGETEVASATVNLPAGDGLLPTAEQAFLDIETTGLAPGEHVLTLRGVSEATPQCNPPAPVVLVVSQVTLDPPILDFGSLRPGEERELRVAIQPPLGAVPRCMVCEELESVLETTGEPDGFVARLRNWTEGPENPQAYQGPGIALTIPGIGFSDTIEVQLQRLRLLLEVPREVDFGSVLAGGTVQIGIRLVNNATTSVVVIAQAMTPGVTFDPGSQFLIPALSEFMLRLSSAVDVIDASDKAAEHRFSTQLQLHLRDFNTDFTVALHGIILPTLGHLCPQCKTINPHGAQACHLCGLPLTYATPALPDEAKRCRKCGGLYTAEYTYCPEDGAKLKAL
jgi:ribosomal protein L40E